jgi:hypothetical protein
MGESFMPAKTSGLVIILYGLFLKILIRLKAREAFTASTTVFTGCSRHIFLSVFFMKSAAKKLWSFAFWIYETIQGESGLH